MRLQYKFDVYSIYVVAVSLNKYICDCSTVWQAFVLVAMADGLEVTGAGWGIRAAVRQKIN